MSAKTLYYTATSVDGFLADDSGGLDWLFDTEQEDDEFGERLFAQVGAMCMGANTYQWVLSHTPIRDDPQQWTRMYGRTPCWVFTHRDLPPIPGADLRFVSGPIEPVHDAMRQAAGDGYVWLMGGGELVGCFLDAGRLDEIQLGVAAAFLGAGAPLLPRRLTGSEVRLEDVYRSKQLVRLRYSVRNRSLCQNADMSDELSQRLGYALKQTVSTVRSAMDESLRLHGLTMAQYACLELLATTPGLSNAELARGAFVTRQSMNTVLHGLQESGLVARPDTVPSGRALPARLTARGARKLDAARHDITVIEERMSQGISATRMRALLRDLQRIGDNLVRLAPPPAKHFGRPRRTIDDRPWPSTWPSAGCQPRPEPFSPHEDP